MKMEVTKTAMEVMIFMMWTCDKALLYAFVDPESL